MLLRLNLGSIAMNARTFTSARASAAIPNLPPSAVTPAGCLFGLTLCTNRRAPGPGRIY